MYKSASLLAIGVAVVALTGCATPRYETVHRYEPPVSVEGRACVASCEAARTQCRSDCQAAWTQCTAQVEPQVESHYAQALADYADELRLYRMDLDRYEWELWLGWHHNYSGFWYSPRLLQGTTRRGFFIRHLRSRSLFKVYGEALLNQSGSDGVLNFSSCALSGKRCWTMRS